MSITLLLLVIALVCALIAALGVDTRGVHLGWLAVALYILAQIV